MMGLLLAPLMGLLGVPGMALMWATIPLWLPWVALGSWVTHQRARARASGDGC